MTNMNVVIVTQRSCGVGVELDCKRQRWHLACLSSTGFSRILVRHINFAKDQSTICSY